MTGQERQYNLLIYGIEKVGLIKPKEEISNRNFKLHFESYNTEKRFNEFDGVILFQGIFENYKYEDDDYGPSYLKHSCDHNELDKRKKELELLLQKGGLACFILIKKFVDSFHGSGTKKNLHSTDLCKCSLNYQQLYRQNLYDRTTHVDSLFDEFTRFLEIYGAACSFFRNFNDNIEFRKIAQAGDSIVSMVLFDKLYFVPSLIPENIDERIIEYFSLLSEALTSSFNKLRVEVPIWLSKISFEKETALVAQKNKLIEEIKSINNELTKYDQFKKILLGSGQVLVENVAAILGDGFSFKLNCIDEYREDLKIVDNDNIPLVFIEVKGTNRGVKREYINQTDSHREHAGFESSFPSLLVMNTHIKNSNSIEDKDKEIADEQIKHAVKMGVLITRTLDLLFLQRHIDNGLILPEEIMNMFCSSVGWLKVDVEGWKIIN